jgi:hypothetical protein
LKSTTEFSQETLTKNLLNKKRLHHKTYDGEEKSHPPFTCSNRNLGSAFNAHFGFGDFTLSDSVTLPHRSNHRLNRGIMWRPILTLPRKENKKPQQTRLRN